MEPNQSSSQTGYPAPAPRGMLEGPISLTNGAVALFKKNWKILSLIVVIPSIIFAIGQLLVAILGPSIGGVLLLITGIIGFVFSIAMQGAIVNAIARVSTETGAFLSIKEQYRLGFKFFWSFVFLMIINFFVFFGAGILIIIPAVIVLIFSMFYTFALVLDGHKGFSALVESYKLVKGRWWKVFGRFLFLILVIAGIGIVLGIITLILNMILGIGPNDAPTVLSIVVSLILNIISTAVIGSISIIYSYRMYVSLKATRSSETTGSGFKKWLIAFLTIGILSIILIPLLAGFAVYNFLVHTFGKVTPESILQFEQQINQQFPNPSGVPGLNGRVPVGGSDDPTLQR